MIPCHLPPQAAISMIYQCQCDQNANDGAGGDIQTHCGQWNIHFHYHPSWESNERFKLPNYSSNKTPEEVAALQACGNQGGWLTSRIIFSFCELRLSKMRYESLFCCCSLAKLCLAVCDLMDCSTPGLSVLHYLLELAQTHIHSAGDAIQPPHPLSYTSPPAFNLYQHWGLF